MSELCHRYTFINSTNKSEINLKLLVENSASFNALREELIVAVKLSTSGITNLVIDYEDPFLVNVFIKSCYDAIELFNGTINIDGFKYVGYSISDAIKHWRKKNPKVKKLWD